MRILTTSDYPLRPRWVAATELISGADARTRVRRLLAASADCDAVVLAASRRESQLTAIALRRRRPRLPLLLEDCTWQLGASAFERLGSRLGGRLLDGPSVHYCVLSNDELELFPTTWHVAAERVHLTLWPCGLSDEQRRVPVAENGYVFAGGDSMRDYAPLVEAARVTPFPVRIATRSAPPVPVERMPANLTFTALPEDEYFRAMAEATLVVVALAPGTERSAGQNNYLQPMALGKLVLVTDATGVRDYVDPGETALVVDPSDPGAMASMLGWALDPANAPRVAEIKSRAKRTTDLRFSPERYVDRLLELVREVS